MLQHISEQLIDDFDTAVGEAIRQVEEHETEQASVSLAVTVGWDKDDRLEVKYQAKDGRKRAGSWRPSLAPRLPFEDGDERRVAFGLDGKPPVETTVGTMKRALEETLGRRGD